MAKRDESWIDDITEILKHLPFWVGPVTAVIAFVFFRFIVLLFIPSAKPGAIDGGFVIRPLLPMLAWIFGGGIFVAWVGAEIHKFPQPRIAGHPVERRIAGRYFMEGV